MSKFTLLHPANITSDKFTYNGVNFAIAASSIEYSGHNAYQYANGAFNSNYGITANVLPPHWFRLSCDHLFITDQFNFNASWDRVYMTVKDYVIEVSKDLSNWTQVYKGVVPETTEYTSVCSFNPVVCKAIRIKILTTYDRRGYTWSVIRNSKVYGKFVDNHYTYNNDNNSYGIKKEGE